LLIVVVIFFTQVILQPPFNPMVLPHRFIIVFVFVFVFFCISSRFSSGRRRSFCSVVYLFCFSSHTGLNFSVLSTLLLQLTSGICFCVV